MNIAFDPWIPVVTLSGKRKLASLCEVLTDGSDFADLVVRPHERVSLMRLFLCVAHAALDGPKDYKEWNAVPEKLPRAAKKYLEDWKDSFELFHKKKPWLQVAELDLLPASKKVQSGGEEEWTPLSRLCFTRASGINSTLFDHESNGGPLTEYTPEQIALNLLTFQNFFVAGGKAPSRVWGKIKMENPQNPKGGPCSGKSILFGFIRSEDLRESIYMNLNTHNDLKQVYPDLDKWMGKPFWELPIKSPKDVKAILNATKTHLGRLVPQTRMVRINGDCKRVLMGPGFEYPKFQDEKNPFFPDQFATTVNNKDEKVELLSARPSISLWRELHSLLVRAKDSDKSSRGPLCLLNVPEEGDCDIIVNSMITNPSQPAEIVNLLESVFHVSSQLRSPKGISTYESEVKEAENLASRLGWAVETYRQEIDHGWEGRVKSAGASKGELKGKLRSIATNHYWTAVEKNLSLLLTHIEAFGSESVDSTRDVWRKMLFKTALDAYRVACGQETPRQMRAFAKGLQRLTSAAQISSPNNNQTQEVNS